MAEIDEAEARKLIEKDVPDEQIAKHFGVGITTFRTWRREKGIMRYSMRKRRRKTAEEVQKMSVPILDVKQLAEKPTPAEQVVERVKEMEKNQQVKIAEDDEGMTVGGMAKLLAMPAAFM